MIYTVQEYCRYLNSRDIRALACTGRNMSRVIRAFTDANTSRETVVKTEYVHATFREMIWSKIDVTFKYDVSMGFEYRFPIQPIIAPTSRDHTGPIILLMKTGQLNVYHCMWARNGHVSHNIYWWDDHRSNMIVYRSMNPLHFTEYINEIIRNEIVAVQSIRENDSARLHVIWAIIDKCSHYRAREEIIHSAEFAEILREM